MPAKGSDRLRLSTSFAARRTRLLAERKLEETRLAHAREAIRRIDREIAELDRERMRQDRRNADEAKSARDVARAAKQFASTATR